MERIQSPCPSLKPGTHCSHMRWIFTLFREKSMIGQWDVASETSKGGGGGLLVATTHSTRGQVWLLQFSVQVASWIKSRAAKQRNCATLLCETPSIASQIYSARSTINKADDTGGNRSVVG